MKYILIRTPRAEKEIQFRLALAKWEACCLIYQKELEKFIQGCIYMLKQYSENLPTFLIAPKTDCQLPDFSLMSNHELMSMASGSWKVGLARTQSQLPWNMSSLVKVPILQCSIEILSFSPVPGHKILWRTLLYKIK